MSPGGVAQLVRGLCSMNPVDSADTGLVQHAHWYRAYIACIELWVSVPASHRIGGSDAYNPGPGDDRGIINLGLSSSSQ